VSSYNANIWYFLSCFCWIIVTALLVPYLITYIEVTHQQEVSVYVYNNSLSCYGSPEDCSIIVNNLMGDVFNE